MSRHPTKREKEAQFLRGAAESRPEAGAAIGNSLPLNRDTLAVLHGMASDPGTSSDALTLLQELQVHQVELNLQREEHEHNEREMGRELSHYKELFAQMPVACLVTTMEGRVVESNPAAVVLLSTGQGELAGQALHDLLRSESHFYWNIVLQKMGAGAQTASCEVLVRGDADEAVVLRISATAFPERDALLLTVTGS